MGDGALQFDQRDLFATTGEINGACEFIADVNTNGRLDIGDAFLMQQLLAGLEEKRTWDDTLNDLNESGTLDSGDVVRVLRTVLGILPQPESPLPILALSSGAIADFRPKSKWCTTIKHVDSSN